MQDKLEAEHLGQRELVQRNSLLGIYPSREWAVKDAARRYGNQPTSCTRSKAGAQMRSSVENGLPSGSAYARWIRALIDVQGAHGQ